MASFDGTNKGSGHGQNINYAAATSVYAEKIKQEMIAGADPDNVDFLDIDNYPGPLVEADASTMTEDEWLRRRTGDVTTGRLGKIGGSSISALFGANHYKDNLQLYHEMLGDAPLIPDEDEGSAAIKDFGHLIEGWVADRIQERYPDNDVMIDTNIYAHANYPYLTVNLDRVMRRPDGSYVLVEIKTTSPRMKSLWDNDSVPLAYLFQVRLQMAVMNINEALVVCMFDRDTIEYRLVRRDLDEEAALLETAQEFWEGNVLPKIPPEPKGTPDNILKTLRKYSGYANKSNTPVILPVTLEDACREYARLHSQKTAANDEFKRLDELCKQASIPIVQQMGTVVNGEVISMDNKTKWYIKYSPRKGNRKVDFKSLEKKYPQAYADCVTQEEEGSRVFSLKEYVMAAK